VHRRRLAGAVRPEEAVDLAVADDEIDAREACRAYHADLERLGIRPHRPLAEDLQLTPA
jgi:hypothetical protein